MSLHQSSTASFMTLPNFDDLFDDLPSSIRIAPLQDPLPMTPTSLVRPCPLEPSTRVNPDQETTKLTGRQLALAQAKPLEGPLQSELDSIAQAKAANKEPSKIRPLDEHNKRKRKLHHHEKVADFVHLPKPKPPTKVEDVNRRPFRPIAALTELHEPPPSAALFPPITPSAYQEEHGGMGDALPAVNAFASRAFGQRGKPTRKAEQAPLRRNYTRGRTKWTETETDQLVKGVAIYGMGRWKDILEHPDFTFRQGRTHVDLKDRFRTLFPPNAPQKWVRKMPEKEDYSDGAIEPLRRDSSRRMRQRAPKRGWTEAEDDELEKGFHKYGYQWNLIAKDESLHFENRTAPQIRDRFRLRWPELYGQEGPPPAKSVPMRKKKCSAPAGETKKKAQEAVEGKEHNDSENRRDETQSLEKVTARGPGYLSGLLNGEEGESVLGGYEWDDNVTLAPLQWEDMVPQPMFDLG